MDGSGPFVRLEKALEGLPNLDVWAQALNDLGLLPIYVDGEQRLVLESDGDRARSVLVRVARSDDPLLWPDGPFWPGWPQRIPLGPSTALEIVEPPTGLGPALRAALPILAGVAERAGADRTGEVVEPFLGPSAILTSSTAVAEKARALVALDEGATRLAVSQFAGSAHYMGSKKLLAGFLTMVMGELAAPGMTVVDLMCGSGAASAAFARSWPTVALDAQAFSVLLARIQGGGMRRDRAALILKAVIAAAQHHAGQLGALIQPSLAAEEELTHAEAGSATRRAMRALVDEFPTYPSGKSLSGWDPVSMVADRRHEPTAEPWCLVTSYFAFVYFGLRQCVEIDSVRFAISRLADPDDRAWALGALVATVSSIGTTYGGHFAQPKDSSPMDLTDEQLVDVLNRRSRSVLHEFSVRLLALAAESERAPHTIETLHAAWPVAFGDLKARFGRGEAAIYVDAPYKREEYSRYYHVLETLVQYDYPASTGKGRLPEKGVGGRFASSFATRDQRKLEQNLADLLCTLIAAGWPCVWSYSDNAAGSIQRVVELVSRATRSHVSSYATPYAHKSQGATRGPGRHPVTEYAVVFRPQD